MVRFRVRGCLGRLERVRQLAGKVRTQLSDILKYRSDENESKANIIWNTEKVSACRTRLVLEVLSPSGDSKGSSNIILEFVVGNR